MVRTIVGILVGIVIAVATVFAIEQIVHLFAPAPPDFDMRDPEQVRARVASLPVTAFVLVLLGWVLGTALGSWAAVRISRAGASWPGLAVGAALAEVETSAAWGVAPSVPGAVRLAYLLTGDRAVAEDITQDAFVRVSGRLAHLREGAAFDAYLRRAVVNLAKNHFRRRAVERAYLERTRGATGVRIIPIRDARRGLRRGRRLPRP